MTTIYILRHGKTENPKAIIKGHLPGFPLDETGKRQIEKAAKLLAKKKISAIYFSPLLRTRQSAQIFQEIFPKAKFKPLKGLTEWHTQMQGKRGPEVRGKSPEFYRRYYESEGRVVARMRKAAERIVEDNPNGQAVVFSHGWPITALGYSLIGRKVKIPMKTFPYKKILVLSLDKNLKLLKSPRLLRF